MYNCEWNDNDNHLNGNYYKREDDLIDGSWKPRNVVEVSLDAMEDPGNPLSFYSQCSKHERVAEPDPKSVDQADGDGGRSHIEEWKKEAAGDAD